MKQRSSSKLEMEATGALASGVKNMFLAAAPTVGMEEKAEMCC
jgi:hypothetical protein